MPINDESFDDQLICAFRALPERDQEFLIALMRRLNSGEISGDEFSRRLSEIRQ